MLFATSCKHNASLRLWFVICLPLANNERRRKKTTVIENISVKSPFCDKIYLFRTNLSAHKKRFDGTKKRLPLRKTLCALFVCVTFFRLPANRSRGSVAKILCTKILLRSGDIPLRTVFAPTGRFH